MCKDRIKMNKQKIVAIFIFCSVFVILMAYYSISHATRVTNKFIDPNLTYILIWTNPESDPIIYLGKGQDTFLKAHCPVNNCYVTSDRYYMNELTDFPVIVIHGPELVTTSVTMPSQRLPHQQYVFASMESSHYYPIKNEKYDNFFNWTWTYKLNSDLYFGYIIIKNDKNVTIGPREDMHWLSEEEMEPIDDALKEKLSHKTLAAAWFVSNCKTPGKREEYAAELKEELARHNMTLDIYGRCGDKKCPRSENNNCNDLIKKQYYFYLSFENSFSEDYVTEKLLTALLNNAVPIVYGGANYTRFLPNGAYLNARQFNVTELVRQMTVAMENKEVYYNYFKWRNHYHYYRNEPNPEENEYCKFCSKVNQQIEDMRNNTDKNNIHEQFRKWWNR